MKKRTVITTETREVWVIRAPSGKTNDYEMVENESGPFADLLIELLDQQPETDTPTDEASSTRTEE